MTIIARAGLFAQTAYVCYTNSMLLSYTTLLNHPVLSLHVGGEIARLGLPIIDPDDLKVIAYTVDGPLVGKGEVGNILMTRDIRETDKIGAIIDSIDVLVNRDDVVKLDQVMKINFRLIGHKVVTKRGSHLGKVIDFTLNPDTFMIQQLIVKRPMAKSFFDPELLIGRSEVVEIDDYKLTVKDEEAKIREKAREDFKADFVNPFRQQRLATIDSQSPDEQDKQ